MTTMTATVETVQRDPIRTITITMDDRDARVLAAITQSIGGAPAGPRGAIDRLRVALELVDIDGDRESPVLKSRGNMDMIENWPSGDKYSDPS